MWRSFPGRRSLLPVALLMMAAAGLTAACGTSPTAARSEWPARPSYTPPRDIRVRVAGRIVTLPLDEYVLGTALAEVSPVGDTQATTERIFEVQAILARTYAVAHIGRHAAEGFDVCDSTHCQLYEPARILTSRFTETARAAVRATAGDILMFGERPTEALFHADCGGHTAAAGDVWGGRPVPYLTGTVDEVPRETHRQWQVDLPVARLLTALNADGRTRIGGHLTSLKVGERDTSGRALSVELRGDRAVTVTGEQFRAILNQTFGVRTVQSTRFSVARAGSAYHFTGSGFGHGVGLCQVGAAARARRGESVAEILAAYFPGAAPSILPRS